MPADFSPSEVVCSSLLVCDERELGQIPCQFVLLPNLVLPLPLRVDGRALPPLGLVRAAEQGVGEGPALLYVNAGADNGIAWLPGGERDR